MTSITANCELAITANWELVTEQTSLPATGNVHSSLPVDSSSPVNEWLRAECGMSTTTTPPPVAITLAPPPAGAYSQLTVPNGRRLKKSAGVARMYTGTAGKTENCQIGVFLAYTSPAGHALIDRELYLPAAWTNDPDRCAAAGIPEHTKFSTKYQLAQRMIERARAADTPFSWVTADEVYGQAEPLRAYLEHEKISYVMAVRRTEKVTMHTGPSTAEVVTAGPETQWQRMSAGEGTKGPRVADWSSTQLTDDSH